ncbi:MAG: sensor histidine kinase, partial [Desulfohalobiaceae bacterium]
QLQQALELLQPEATRKHVCFKNIVPAEIAVHADVRMLLSVLHNLLSNALKFSSPGGSVRITAQEQGQMIQVEVRDQGLGMDQETLANLFSLEGKRSQNGTAGEKGSGLGLILCREFIQRHAGEVWAWSEPGQGTAIYFTLPRG